jgi:signal transduction histidine kinase
LLNLALISLLFCVLCLAQYFLLANFLKTTLINSLQTEAKAAIEQRAGGPDFREGGQEHAGQRLTANFVSKTTLAVLIDSNGRVIKPALDTTTPATTAGNSLDQTNLPTPTASDSQTGVGPEIDLASLDPALNQLAKPPSDLLQRALKGETGLSYTTNLAGWDEAVVVLVPFTPNNPPPQPRPPDRGQPAARNASGPAVLVIAGSNTANETTLADLLLINAGAFVVLLVVIGLVSPLVAGSSLRPLRRMIKTTQQIAGGDLSRRVQLESDRDEIGQLAFSFNRMVDQLERQFKTQRQLVADASHELRTPLTAIKGSLEVMLLGGTASNPDAANRLLKTMHRESVRLTQLVNDLLTLSKLDQGETVYLQPVNLLNLVQEIKAGIELFIQQGEKEINLAVEGFGSFGESPVWVYGSPERLKQVLYNLLDNAVKFSPPGSNVTLELEGLTRLPPGLKPLQRLPGTSPAETGNREQPYYRLAVKDQGPGIAPADLPHIFDRFYRGDTSRTRRNGGSGLGLAIAQAFLAAQGGFVTVESRLGQGTTFYVYLPAFKDGWSENPAVEKNTSTTPVS